MKKLWLGVAAMLLGSSLTYGYDSEIRNDPISELAEQTAQALEENSGLMPKRTTTVVRAQQTPPAPYMPTYEAPHVAQAPAPQVATVDFSEPVRAGGDSYLYSELDRLSDAVQQIKKDTAKPDTKKAWGPPKIVGYIALDSVNVMNQNAASRAIGDMSNGTGFRELRLGAVGNGYDGFDYKVEVGFHANNGTVTLFDNWVGVKNVPLLGYFRAGYFKPEPGLYFSMGAPLTSLMEVSTPVNPFGLGRKIGIASQNLFADDRVRLFAGVFQGASGNTGYTEDNQGQVVNLRLTAAPWFCQEGKKLLHIGGHWEYVSTEENKAASSPVVTSVKPGAFGNVGPFDPTLTAGPFPGDSHRGGLELSYNNGRFSARSELLAGSFNDKSGGAGRHLYGAYAEVGYFLTDDFRTYNLTAGNAGPVKMKNNFHPFKCGEWNLVDGFGAWQAVFQWGYTDMEDWRVGTNGGHQNDFVAGLNWFWSPQMRWVFEYVHSDQNVGTAHSKRSQDILATSIRFNW
ncbi:MAG: hypothetical protein LBI05_01400 [Planctomycetaceae bacterium]|jgi:phosphate-selective porin OprO/OprP|nr:hypothetical protein [Planctomycetaceae bacterium]